MQEQTPTKRIKQVPCPNCKTLSDFSPQNIYRPFCSERCKMIDLGDWANESYKIPDKSPPKNSDETN
ncbi:MAG: DNA gyrase inhibitor YacG [Methylophilaceae bacterium]